MDSRVSREIGHDEYDPWGTLSLIVLYFVALTLMWLFTYFIEFVGNEPTVFSTGVWVIVG
ncbi:cytochrome oxidase [Haloterrigena sp. H1]|uniref:cytochrome oxidase n=1 Tax=Haloterrigena sp. H1 TaxID=2552943 RepID=UPI00110F13A3|nr:cytochrome oxidase [Haloterrigena sp. H1]TMT86853.1 cytochrome oxidase [Haloterrigena sp. H1]